MFLETWNEENTKFFGVARHPEMVATSQGRLTFA